MFNIGWSEIVVIGVIALIAIGPKELPFVLRTAGRWMGKVRRMANEFQGQFQEALREAELHDIKKQAEELTSSVNESVAELSRVDPLADSQKEIESALAAHDAEKPPAPEALPAPQAQPTPPDHAPAVAQSDVPAAAPATEPVKSGSAA